MAARKDSSRVQATLLELDGRNVDRADRSIRASGLQGVTVTRVDAGISDAYVGRVPADLVLLCGVFGNITDEAVHRLIEALPQLCNPGATLVWTRARREPDLTGTIRRWVEAVGFREVSVTAPADVMFTVGRNRFVGTPQALQKGVRLFDFVR